MFINLHDGSLVAAAVTVVGGTEYGDDVPILTPIVALHDQLMRSGDQCQAVIVVEGF